MPWFTKKNNRNKNKAYKNLANARKATGRMAGHSRIANIFSPRTMNANGPNYPRMPEITNVPHNAVRRAEYEKAKVLAKEISDKLPAVDRAALESASADLSNSISQAKASGSQTVTFTIPIYVAVFLKIALAMFMILLLVPAAFADAFMVGAAESEPFVVYSLLSVISSSITGSRRSGNTNEY